MGRSRKKKKNNNELFQDDEEDNGMELKINQSFARNYEQKKKKELESKYADKLKQGVGNINDEDDESSSEIEDEYGELFTKEVDTKFLEILPRIMKKDKELYEKDKTFFPTLEEVEKQLNEKGERKKPEKPLYIKDQERENLLRKGPEHVDYSSSEEEEEAAEYGGNKRGETHVEEQERLKNEFKKAAFAAMNEKDDNDDENFGGFLKKKNRSKRELEEEEKEQKVFEALLEKKAGSKDTKSDVSLLEKFWADESNMDANEKFLKNFIIKEQWRETKKNLQGKDIVLKRYGESDDSDDSDKENGLFGLDFDEEEEQLEKEEEFEHKYNFRYEEK